MNLTVKLKETTASIVPIMIIVIILGCTAAPLGGELLLQFIIGGIQAIIGLTLFLVGVDMGILPIGTAVGAALVKKRNLVLLLSAAFITGFFVTAAEPDVQVLADQIMSVSPDINKLQLVLMISAGIGLFTTIGLLRTVLSIPLHWVLILSYGFTFMLAAFTPAKFLAVAFDSGGATTGPMTVPFIMALGVGVAAVRGRDNDSFGLTGIASIGPIGAVLLFGIMSGNSSGTVEKAAEETAAGMAVFYSILPGVFSEVLKALLPLTVLFIVFQITLVKMPPLQVRKMIKGIIYSLFGLILFLTGVKGGFMPAGTKLGEILGTFSMQSESVDGYTILLVAVGLILGAAVVCAEPAVWVLTNQVEEVSGGTVKRRLLLIALSAGVALSIGLSMIRVILGFSIWWYLIPGYAAALTLTFFCPRMFTAVAFDSGGVASGPMTSTFILSFTLGAAIAYGGNPVTDAFGVIALVAMTPLITIQIVGLVFRNKMQKNEKGVTA